MEKRTSPVKEEQRDVPAAAAGGGILKEEEEELKSTRAEVGEAREENERLKKVLTRIVKDYQALQMHFFDIVQQQDQPPPPAAANKTPSDRRRAIDNDDEVELEPELVSLRLGTSTSTSAEVHEAKESEKRGKGEDVGGGDADDDIEGLSLGLDSKFGSSVSRVAAAVEPPPGLSSDNSSEEAKEQEPAGEPWPPGKAAKNSRGAAEEEATPQAQVKRARVSVRARCDTPTMNDGCQWRKYGQKVSKGNPCPRAYYRCTVAPLCPVRKQVQRCAEDMSILITTYEGTHNHPLPISATAMASTTSAAACMLTSGSSGPRISGLISAPSSSSSSSTSAYNNPHGPSHFYLQNQLISPSTNSHPTITLDLTNKYNSNSNSNSNFGPRCPPAPTTFNFSSSIEPNSMPSWTTTSQPPFNYKSSTHMYSSLVSQAYWQRAATSSLPPPAPSSNMSTDTIARAITSDPSFQSALAAAITSYVGARPVTDASHCHGPRHSISRTASLGSSRQGGLPLLQHPMPVAVSGPKSASGSPVDDLELQAD